jgi:hypothetical protein
MGVIFTMYLKFLPAADHHRAGPGCAAAVPDLERADLVFPRWSKTSCPADSSAS